MRIAKALSWGESIRRKGVLLGVMALGALAFCNIESNVQAADITINFLKPGTNPDYPQDVPLLWTENAKSAVQKAANIWAALLISDITINIDACWAQKLNDNVPGRGAPFGTWCKNFSGAPLANVQYPPALANALGKKDLDPATAEIYIAFDSTISWGYKETDVVDYNLITYALHNICHGLGFASMMTYDESTKIGKWGGSAGLPTIWDTFIQNDNKQHIIDTKVFANGTAELGAQLMKPLYFVGVSDRNLKAQINTPIPWVKDISYIHLNDGVYANTDDALMTSLQKGGLSKGAVVLAPGPATISMLKDMGWNRSVSIGLKVDPSSLNPTCEMGTNVPQDKFNVWVDSGVVHYTVTTDQSWLSCTPSNGNAKVDQQPITITYNTLALPVGTHTATITLTGDGGEKATVGVSLVVSSSKTGNLKVSPETLNVTAAVGTNASTSTFSLSTLIGSLSYKIAVDSSWLSCSPSAGTANTTPQTIGVTFNTASLAEGAYMATITVTGSDASVVKVVVGLNIGSMTGGFYASVDALTNTCAVGSDAQLQSFVIWTTATSLSYSISGVPAWLTCTPLSGNLVPGKKQIINLSYATSSLAAGVYTATLLISDGGSATLTVGIQLTVGMNLKVSPSALNQACGVSTDAPSQVLQVWNSGTGSLSFTVSDDVDWLSCTPAVGISTSSSDIVMVTVNYSTKSMAIGTYMGTITVKPASGSNIAVPVTLKILDTPVLGVDTTSIDLSISTSFVVQNSGTGDLYYNIQDDSAWLTASPSSGMLSAGATQKIEISYTTDGLSIGAHTALITVTGANAVGNQAYNSPTIVSCLLQIGPSNVTTDGLDAVIAADNDGITVNSKGQISFCPDLSGAISGASQRSKPKQPILTADAEDFLNGNPSMTYDYKKSLLLPSTPLINSDGPYDEKTVCVVFRTGIDVTKRQIIYEEGSKKSGLNIYIENSTLVMGAWNTKNKQDVPVWGPVFISADITTETVYVATLVLEQVIDNMSGYLNGVIFASTSGVGSISGDPEQGSIGGLKGSTQYNGGKGSAKGFNGLIAEFWYYNNALAGSDIVNLSTYLKTKYGIQ